MKEKVQIGKRNIGKEEPVFIIAEAGVNHNGKLDLAKQLVLEAKRCGADCVKFQTFQAERVVTKNAPKANYQLKTTDSVESQFEMLKKCELKMEYHKELIKLCAKEDIIFLSTPYNIEDVDFLDSLNVSAFKLSSIHVVESYFITYVANKGRPIILSTGMATLSEVHLAIKTIRETGNENILLLQCTTNYPSRHEDANLRAMQNMGDIFDVIVGYSDHTQNNTACMASVALGGKILEKHFTLDKSLPGPDHTSSADPDEFYKLVQKVRETEIVLGSNKKQPCEVEKKNAIGMRRSLVSKIDIVKNDVITESMITFKRPSSGISPNEIDKIIGKKASVSIPIDTLIDWNMVQ
ncbi:MAG: N-acetylneuraminate synthase [Candidatus Marinimicrobia bacterium]|nr:N-acetylneuraminate synthase [Candidatus Neomarinimicrobiota bacterium]|tara:strand:+ start:60665 stop:61717 length:1053 start_codon:yes stop_codon:yes gene_type:complete